MNIPIYPYLKLSATKLRLTPAIVAAAYFLIFPFFFFYHSFVSLGFISLFLGNWWTASHALSLVVLFPIFISKLNKNNIILHIPIIIIILICFFVSIYHYMYGFSYSRGIEPLIYTTKMIVSWTAFYIIGFFFPINHRFSNALAASCAVIFLLTIFIVISGPIDLYQYLSQALVFSAFIPMAVFWGDRRVAIVGGATFAALIYLLSRSELVGFSAVLAGLMVMMAVHRRWTLILQMGTATLVATILITGVLAGSSTIRAWIEEGGVETQIPTRSSIGDSIARQSELGDLENSRSFQIRREFLKSGWNGIVSKPFWGDYAGQIRDFNDPGSYIHNVLSVWRQYGLVVFVLYTGLCLLSACLPAWRVLIGKKTSPHWLLAAMVGGYCLVLVIAAKAVFWPMPALAWGLLASRFQEDQMRP